MGGRKNLPPGLISRGRRSSLWGFGIGGCTQHREAPRGSDQRASAPCLPPSPVSGGQRTGCSGRDPICLEHGESRARACVTTSSPTEQGLGWTGQQRRVGVHRTGPIREAQGQDPPWANKPEPPARLRPPGAGGCVFPPRGSTGPSPALAGLRREVGMEKADANFISEPLAPFQEPAASEPFSALHM